MHVIFYVERKMKTFRAHDATQRTTSFNQRNRYSFFPLICRDSHGSIGWWLADELEFSVKYKGYKGGPLSYGRSQWYEYNQFDNRFGSLKPIQPLKSSSFVFTNEVPKSTRLVQITSMSEFVPITSKTELTLKVLKMNIQENVKQELSVGERYAISILRPNIMTSEMYAGTFLEGTNFNFILENTDIESTLKEIEVDNFTRMFKDRGYTVSVEKGFDKKEDIESVRMTVMDYRNEQKELVCVWLFYLHTYSIHFKDRSQVQELIAFMRDMEVKIDKKIMRCYSGGNSLSISPVKIDGRFQIHDEFYPTVKPFGGMTKLIEQYRKSSSNLMILAGQWGGGKSALFQAMCYADNSGKSVYFMIDDPNVYVISSVFSDMIKQISSANHKGKTVYLFLEEADDFIRSKKENPFLSRLASLANGAASLDIKIIVATNDTSEATIDPALIRAGRLFSMIKFNLLTPEEANESRKVLGLNSKHFDCDVSLSEALTEDPIFAGVATSKTNKILAGFVN